MLDNLRSYRIVLGSGSPRRRELLSGLGLDFSVRLVKDGDESYSKEHEMSIHRTIKKVGEDIENMKKSLS